MAGFIPLFMQALRNWNADRCSTMAAALSFYAAFSLAPILLIVLAVASSFFGVEAVQGKLFNEIRGVIGSDGATALQAMIASAWHAQATWITTVISLVAIFIGASVTFSELNRTLNVIWGVESVARRSAIFDLIRVRLISFGLVVGIGFLLIVMLVFDAAVIFIVEKIWVADAVSQIWLLAVQRIISVIILAAAFALLLKVLPDKPMKWSDVAIGAVFSAFFFSVGKQLFALYLVHANMASTFGAAGSLAIILMWLYFSSALFLLGAEIAAAETRLREEALTEH